MKIKIAYIVSTLRQAGPTNQLYGILKYLDKEKFEPVIITLSPEAAQNSMIELFRQLNIPVIGLELSRLKGLISGKRKLGKVLLKIKPDIIHTQGIRPDMMAHGLKMKYPHVLSLRNYPFDDYPAKFGKVMGKMMARSHYKVISKEKNATLCSRSLSEIYLDKHQLNLGFIQNGVNVEKYFPLNEKEKTVLKNKLNIPEGKKIIISVGSLIPRKCTDIAIKAFLKSSIKKNSLFIIAGDGFEKSKLEEITNGDPSVLFLGEINNVKEYLQVADMFVSVSSSEGLPNTVLEAMACKLPVLLSNILPHAELVGNNYPYLSTVNDVERVTRNFESLMNSDLDKIGDEMLQIVSHNFTAEIMSKKYQDLYQRILYE
ncbi:MAG: glycosyltransferase [Bacteroidales bacterium]